MTKACSTPPTLPPPILRTLPALANLEQLRKQAKDLLQQHERQQAVCCEILRWLNRFALSQDAQIIASKVALHEAQDAVAMSYGFRNWQAMLAWVERNPGVAIDPGSLAPEAAGCWRAALERLARLAGVPIAIIQRLDGPFIEVIADNGAIGNPLPVGEKRRWQATGTYWETVVKTLAPIVVPDARADEAFSDCPLIELGLVSCAGIPIAAPDGTAFGVLSLLARQRHEYPEHVVLALEAFQALLEAQLRQVTKVEQLGARIQQLSDLLLEQRTVREIIPICAYCKRVRDDAEQWHEIEELLSTRIGSHPSHSICPDCMKRLNDGDFEP